MKITRIYVDNYRCLQDFTFHPKELTLLVGVNGSGKSSIREVLFKLRQVMEGDDVKAIFSHEHLTAWRDDETKQKFELDIEINNHAYEYRLEIVHNVERDYCEVDLESLICDDEVLFESDGTEANLFRSDGNGMIHLVANTRGSALSQIPESRSTKSLSEFREVLLNLVAVAINPVGMSALSQTESAHPTEHFENFLDWLRLNSSQYQEEYIELIRTLTQILPEFKAFQFDPAGEGVKEFFLKFSNSESGNYRIRFDRISDGQRVLVILYSLLAFAEYYPIVFLDEPQNFVSLQEIKPWLLDAMDKYEDVGGQLLLSSHNSEFINLLAPKYGVWLERTPDGPTQVKLDVDFTSSPLRPSQLITRGWIDE